MSYRTFKCRIQEGTYQGEVTVSVEAGAIEWNGNQAIETAAWREWRRTFGPSIGMAYTSCRILEEVA